jgi:hypothetical protein
MVEIKEVYSKTHQRSLADDIHAHCKEEDLRDILLSLIKGNYYSNFLVAFFLRKESYLFGNIFLNFLLTKIFFFFSLEWNKDEEVSSYKTIERSK